MWESVDHHKAAAADKNILASVMEHLAAVGKAEYYCDVLVKEDASPCLNAPTSEFASIALKEGADAALFEDRVTKLNALAHQWGRSKGNWGAAWGPVADRKGKYFNILGWDSVEVGVLDYARVASVVDAVSQVFKESVHGSSEAMAIIHVMRELADIKVQHVHLSKY